MWPRRSWFLASSLTSSYVDGFSMPSLVGGEVDLGWRGRRARASGAGIGGAARAPARPARGLALTVGTAGGNSRDPREGWPIDPESMDDAFAVGPPTGGEGRCMPRRAGGDGRIVGSASRGARADPAGRGIPEDAG